MDNLIEFAKDNYIILIIVSTLLILALIGYIADKKGSKDIKIKKKKNSDHNQENNTVDTL